MVTPAEPPVVIVGAGPGGLTAAYLLTKRGEHPVVLEADDVVGGISRTVVRDGWPVSYTHLTLPTILLV